MEPFTSNFVHSSFEHLIHLYGLHVVSTYKYKVDKCLFDFIFYLLNNRSSSLVVPLHIAIIYNILKQLTMQFGPLTFFETYIS